MRSITSQISERKVVVAKDMVATTHVVAGVPVMINGGSVTAIISDSD